MLSLFGSQREEDKMVGYLSFLKVGPQLLKWVPGKKAADLKHWLTTYGYWNQVGLGLSLGLYFTTPQQQRVQLVPSCQQVVV